MRSDEMGFWINKMGNCNKIFIRFPLIFIVLQKSICKCYLIFTRLTGRIICYLKIIQNKMLKYSFNSLDIVIVRLKQNVLSHIIPACNI